MYFHNQISQKRVTNFIFLFITYVESPAFLFYIFSIYVHLEFTLLPLCFFHRKNHGAGCSKWMALETDKIPGTDFNYLFWCEELFNILIDIGGTNNGFVTFRSSTSECMRWTSSLGVVVAGVYTSLCVFFFFPLSFGIEPNLALCRYFWNETSHLLSEV